jgi:hypothetical protein
MNTFTSISAHVRLGAPALVLSGLIVCGAAPLAAPGPGGPAGGGHGSQAAIPVRLSAGSAAVRVAAAPHLAVVAERHYTLNAHVRLLFFWIGRDNVGSGRVTWAEGPDGSRGYELLIGSDPDRAPRRINRWGYVAERSWAGGSEILGVMTESDEATAKEAEARVTAEPDGRYGFKAIRAVVTGDEARATVMRLALAENLTYRDLPALLRRLPPADELAPRVQVPAGAERGFLTAVSHLVDASVADHRRLGKPPAGGQCTYVYDRGLYDLTLVSSRVLAGKPYAGAIESCFEIRNRTTGALTRFQMTYGASGSLAGVPLRIVYRPRGWFEAELVLDPAAR